MVSSLVVPVIDVQNDTFKELWPAMVVAIKTSSFVALDTELSGLGNRKSLLAESIEDRYKAICHAARSRSILSLGFACYKKLDDKAADTYLVQVYNLTLLCSEEYIIEPQSVQFLVQHGFDFNKQYAHGIPYCKGNNKAELDDRGVHIRALFTELLRARKPLVLHNGLIDMAFLYQSFYAHLPERLTSFTADLSEMFPAGIYDTKYVTEFELRLTASYLEYAYKKCKLDTSRSATSGGNQPHVQLEFCQYAGNMSRYVDYRVCPAVGSAEGQTDICQRFSAFGWCSNGTQCPLSHDTDLIVLQDEKGLGDKKNKRKRRKEKKRGRGETAEDSSIFDGAPEHKMPNMEVDSKETPDDQLGTEPCPERGPLMDGDRNALQNEEEGMKADSEGNGVCEDNADFRNPVTTSTTDDTKTKTNDGEECRTGDGEKLSDHSPKTDDQKKKADSGTHRAGFDAFMTGYIFAHSCTLKKDGAGAVEQKKKAQENKEVEQQKVVEQKKEVEQQKEVEQKMEVEQQQKKEEQPLLPTCLNKVYLSGKAAPLNVVKSTFSKSSKAHVQKMAMVWGQRV
ncbi:target of EGR1 protein 1 [Cottoperca gobio]|uniref:Target of EGR1 protein 1 n=1 Tax=Cottoperca gobio TaxID=56716 RepID=A0A6J2RHX6_COTGO|nr:target of EGR1 protein 1 [Cottoperca gobio]XP_029309056.1 target of EGR1 protein 1 [Cottoperca gobio]XP_029309057.1 target of EGR1 protein 1 [Cottoperca gobio]